MPRDAAQIERCALTPVSCGRAYDGPMSTATRDRRPLVLAAAAALALGGLTGCAQIEEITGQSEELQGHASDLSAMAEEARASLQGLEDLSRAQLESFDWSALDQYRGTWFGDEAKVEDMFQNMPGAEGLQDVSVKQDQGALEVTYGEESLRADPAVLEETLREQAEQAKQRLDELKTVEFKVGDKTYTF